MVSIKTERCITPLPKTKNLSVESLVSKCNAKLCSNSFSKRSLMWREVTNFPSFPKKGESLIVKSILMVGSSISILGNASGSNTSAMVSPKLKDSNPIIAQMSPAST